MRKTSQSNIAKKREQAIKDLSKKSTLFTERNKSEQDLKKTKGRIAS